MKTKASFSSEPGARPLPLNQLRTTGRVVAIDGADDDLHRLEEMGLCGGRIVEVVRGGDPMIVRVLGTRIGLAARLAMCVQVEPPAGDR